MFVFRSEMLLGSQRPTIYFNLLLKTLSMGARTGEEAGHKTELALPVH